MTDNSTLNEKEEQYLAVASCFLFSKPDGTSLKTHYDQLTPIHFNKGDQIINKGAVDAGLYLIVSGSVDVAVTGNIFVLLSSPTCSYMSSHGDKSQRYILDVVLESDSFGEELVLDPDTPCALEYYAKTDCVLLHASSETLTAVMQADAIFRDRLVMLNNAKRARRDASVQLLHNVAQIMRDSGLLIKPEGEVAAAPFGWPSTIEEAAAAEAAAIKARKQEENNYLLSTKTKMRRTSLSLAGIKTTATTTTTATDSSNSSTKAVSGSVMTATSAPVRDRGKIFEPKVHERKRNKSMLSTFFNFGKDKSASSSAPAAAAAAETNPFSPEVDNSDEEEGEEDDTADRVTEEDLSALAAMEDLVQSTNNMFAVKTNCIDTSISTSSSSSDAGRNSVLTTEIAPATDTPATVPVSSTADIGTASTTSTSAASSSSSSSVKSKSLFGANAKRRIKTTTVVSAGAGAHSSTKLPGADADADAGASASASAGAVGNATSGTAGATDPAVTSSSTGVGITTDAMDKALFK